MPRTVRLALGSLAAVALACADPRGAEAPPSDGASTLPDGPTSTPDGSGGPDGPIPVSSTGTCVEPEVITIGAPVSGELGAGEDGQTGGCVIGGGGHDAVFQVTPDTTGELRVVLSSDADLALYARSSCGDEMSELDCGDAAYGGDDEAITIPTIAGTPFFLIVDAYTAEEAGPFTLAMAYTDAGSACGGASAALATNSGDNAGGSADLIGSCGGDGPETVFSYTTPGAAGDLGELRITARAPTGDLVLHVRATCTDAASELGCSDLGFFGGEERLTVPLAGATPVVIVVDSYAPPYAGSFSLAVDWLAAVCGDGMVTAGECEPPNTPFCDGSCRPIF